MKKLALILFLLLKTLAYGQNGNISGYPASGVTVIPNGESQTISSKTNVASPSNQTLSPGSPTGNSGEVGVTAGQLSVSLTGGANYDIPIALPPGINGVVPQIGLSYNSQGGIGNAGYGWNVSGVSKISRIASTKFHDGKNTATDCSINDRFTLDGQRLIIKNSTDVYGANGAVYETENFSNIKVTSYGTTPYAGFSGVKGPDYFIVEYPDGSKAKYGSGYYLTSAVDWRIEYWENPQGIRITYGYQLSGTNLLLSSITYGYKGAWPSTTFNLIQFVYKPAGSGRSVSSYVGGVRFDSSSVIGEIKVTNNGVGYRNYILDYDTSSLGYNRLIKITEKSGDNSKSYNPTVFSYDTTPETITYDPVPTNLNVSGINYNNSSTLSGDFDGDGQRDIILYPTTGTDAKKKYWLFSHLDRGNLNIGYEHNIGAFEDIFPITWLGGSASFGYKLMPMQGWCVLKKNATTNVTSFTNYSIGTVTSIYFQDNKDYIFPKYNVNTQETETTGSTATNYKDITKKFVSGDFNGDGLSDILAIELNREFLVPNTLGKNVDTPSIVDPGGGGGPVTVNYVGKTYFVNLDRRLTSNYVTIAGSINVEAGNNNLIVDDVNGDGKSDLLVFTSGVVKVYSMDTNNQLQLLWTTTDGNISYSNPVLMGDYNGDGKTDFITPKGIGNNYAKFTSSGIGFFKEDVVYDLYNAQNTVNGSCYTLNYIMPTDFNKDGKTDLVCATSYACTGTGAGSITVRNFKNTGTNFVSEGSFLTGYATTGIQAGIGTYPVPVFLNNDKQISSDQVNFITNNQIIHFKSAKDFSKDHLLKSITLGNGAKQGINYKGLSYTDSNYAGPYENYPNFDINVAENLQVVTSLESISHSQYKKQDYMYYGAVTNTEGLGFLGFRGLAKTNWYNDDFTPITTVSKFDLTKRGALVENTTILGQVYGDFYNSNYTGYISKSTMTYVDQLMSNKVYKINNTKTIDSNGLNGTSKEVTTTFDSTYNYPLTSTTITKNGGATEQTEIATSHYSDNACTSCSVGNPYYIGRLADSNTSVSNAIDTKTSEIVYTYTNNLVSKIQKKGHLTNYLTEEFSYDASGFGNIIKKTTTAVGLSPRITNYQYDPLGKYVIKTATDGLETKFTYDPSNGLVISEINPYNLTTQYAYDVWGKRKTVTDYLNNISTTDYVTSPSGYFYVTNTGADGSYNISEHDDLGRLLMASVKNIDNKHSSVKTQYDIYDRPISVSEPYDSLNNSPSLFTTTTYDVYGRPNKISEANGKITTMGYTGLTTTVADGIKTVVTVKNSLEQPQSVTDNGGVINYTYYADGNIKTTDFEGNTIKMEYNGWGKKTKLEDPSAGTYRYDYNEFGEVTSEITPKGTTTYILDPYGRVLQKNIVGSGSDTTNSKTTYHYDASKLLDTTTYDDIFDTSHHIDYAYFYDSSKRIIRTTENNQAKAEFERKTDYDGFGRPLREFYSATNSVDGKKSIKWVRNTYVNGYHSQTIDDVSNKVLWQTNGVNERGQLTSATLGNGIAISNTYNPNGFPTQFKHDLVNGSTTTNVMTLNNSFNIITGNLNTRSNSLFNTNETFGYDTLDRLIEWAGTPRELYNLTFKTFSEDFVGVDGASLTVDVTERLKIAASNPRSGAMKLIINDAAQGDEYKIKVTVDDGVTGTGIYQMQAVVIEEDPSTGNRNEYPIGSMVDGVFEANHIIHNDHNKIYLKFEKSENQPFIVKLRKFFIDNLIITKLSGKEKQSYDNKGRIIQNNVGDYNYTKVATTPPYAPLLYQNSSVTTSLEATSRYQTRALQDVTYNAFKSPVKIVEDGVDKINFLYNPFNSRSDMYYGGLDDDKMQRCNRKFYSADGSMEISYDKCTGKSKFITYIEGDGYSAPIVFKKDDVSEYYLYLHRDYQGSILAITNEAGGVVEKRLFDAWGAIALVKDGNDNVLTGLIALDRGYTGHEHLQSVGLLNMNARLYDPNLHRFLQPDNLVQDPYNTQNYNRYGYVMNNPMKYVDYSGDAGEVPYEQYPGPSNTQQTWLGNGISTLGQNWDNWGIKDWSNKNLNFKSWGNGLKSAGNFIGRNVRSIGDWFGRNINSIFGSHKTETRQLPSTPTFSNHQLTSGWQNESVIQMPTQHTFLGVNMTGLSEGNFVQQAVYGIANGINIPIQYMMGRGVGDGSMRNLNGTSTTTDEGVMSFGTLPLYFMGGEAASSIEGKTFSQYRTEYWAGKLKPELEPIINRETGQVWKQYMELHHRFIPQRWEWAPNWLKNNRFNLQELSSLEHAIRDPYRARFAPKWVKEMFNLVWK